VSTPAGVRKPDVFVVPKPVARSAISRQVRTFEVWAGSVLSVADPFPVSFDPVALTELD